MDVLSLGQLIKDAGLPGALAIGTAVFLWLYLRSERSQPVEPEWARSLRAEVASMRSEMRETRQLVRSFATTCSASTERVNTRLDSVHELLVELKTRSTARGRGDE